MIIKRIPDILRKEDREEHDVEYSYQSVKKYFKQLWPDKSTRKIYPVVSGKRVGWDYIPCAQDEILFINEVENEQMVPVVVGAVLTIVGVYTWNPYLMGMGISMLVGAAVGALAGMFVDKPKTSFDSSATYGWNDIKNIVGEGTPVPLVFGRHKMGGVVIEAFLSSKSSKYFTGYGFYQATEPTEGMQEGDIWEWDGLVIQIRRYYDGSDWIDIDGEFSVGEFFWSLIAPIGAGIGDIWRWDDDEGNEIKRRYVGDEWVEEIVGEYGLDQDQKYLNVLLALSEGEIHGVEDGTVKVDNKSIDYYGDDAEYWAKTGTNTQDAIPNFSSVSRHYTMTSNIKITNGSANAYTYKSYDEIDRATVTISIPALFKTDSDGDIHNMTVTVAYKYALDSTTPDWSDPINVDITRKTKTTVEHDIEIRFPSRGEYLIQIERLTGNFDTLTRINGDTYLKSVTEYIDQTVAYRNTALMGVTLKATNKLSGKMPDITCIMKGIKLSDVRDDTVTEAGAKNPANIINGIFMSSRWGLGRYMEDNAYSIDLDSFKEYANWCDEVIEYQEYNSTTGVYDTKTQKRYEINLVVDQKYKAKDLIDQICATTRSSLYWVGNKIKIVSEKPDETYAQVFNMGNIVEDSFKETYVARKNIPSQMDGTFRDEDNDFEQTSITAIDQDRLGEGPQPKNVKLYGLTNKARAKRELKFAIKKAKAGTSYQEFNVFVDGIACEPGDVVLLQHDVAQYGFGGRILSVGDTSVTVDQNVNMAAGSQYSLRLRKNDNTNVVYTWTQAEAYNGNEIDVGEAIDSGAAAYDLWLFGIINKEGKPVRVQDISKAYDNVFTLKTEDYNSSVFDDDSSIDIKETKYSHLGLIESYDIDGSITDPPATNKEQTEEPSSGDNEIPPDVTDVILTEHLRLVGDVLKPEIIVSFPAVKMPYNSRSRISRYFIMVSTNTGISWKKVDEVTTAGSYTISDVEVGETYYVIIKPVTNYDKTNSIEFTDDKTEFSITIQGKTAVPLAPANLAITEGTLCLTLDWDNPLTNDDGTTLRDFSSIEIWCATANDRSTAVRVGTDKGEQFTHSNLNHNVTYYYWIRSGDTAGNYSAWHPVSSTAGVSGSPSNNPAVVLDLLESSITQSQLAAALSSEIDLIGSHETRLDTAEGDISQAEQDIIDAQGQITTIQSDLAEIQAIPEFNASDPDGYLTGDMVKYESALYRALQDMTTAPHPLPTNTTYWEKIGDYASLGDAVAEHEVLITQAVVDIQTNADEILTKVSQTEYDLLESTVTGHTTSISQNADAIELKADQTEVDTIDGTVSSHTTLIGQNADAIVLKADQTEVDTIDGEVNTLQGEMALSASQWTVKHSNNDYVVGVGQILYPEWDSVTSYTTGDYVYYDVDEKIYEATANSTNKLPTNTDYWEEVPYGARSEFITRTDRFAIVKPDESGETVSPFIIDAASGMIVMNSDLIVTGSITVGKLASDATGRMFSDSTKSYADLSGAPASLNDISSSEYTHLDGIEAGADVTATHTANNVSNVGTRTATEVNNAVINFDARNDRDDSAITAPVIPSDGSAVDHVNNSDSSVDISFEWTWAGTEADIDGFRVYIYAAAAGTAYTFGTTESSESIFFVQPSKRSFIITGAPADKHYTFGVEAYRVVDPDVNATGWITSSLVQCSRTEEDPYQPETSPAYSGDISGTIDWSQVTDDGGKPADNADVTDYTDTRVANAIRENHVTTILRPLGASYEATSSVTGAIKIALPQSWSNTMMRFVIDVYLYSSGRSFSLEVGGYNYSTTPGWYNTFASLLGSIASDNAVRFGHDGAVCCVYVGELASEWNYPKISVRNFQASHNNDSIAQWESGWSITLETTAFGTPLTTISNSLIDARAVQTLVGSDLEPAEAGATLGATWGVDIDGEPVSLNDIDADEFNVIASQNSDSFISGNLIYNGNMTMVAFDGRPLGVKACYSNNNPATISYQDAAKTILKVYSSSDSSIGAGFPAFRVNPDTEYKVFVRAKASVVCTNGFYIDFSEYNDDLPTGITHVGYDGNGESGEIARDDYIRLASGVGISDAWEVFEYEVTPTATAKWASIVLLNYIGMGTAELHVDRVVVTEMSTRGAPSGTYVGGTLAENVESNASTALSNAEDANLLLADIADDNKLTASEKQQTKVEWDGIVEEKPEIEAQATALGITTEKTAYTSAYDTLDTYITPLLSNLGTTSNITGSTFRSNFAAYYEKRQLLLNAITQAVKDYAFPNTSAGGLAYKTKADWTDDIEGTDKPEDNATVGTTAEEYEILTLHDNQGIRETFDDSLAVLDARWSMESGTAETSKGTSGVAGDGTYIIGNNSGDDSAYIMLNRNIPYDPDKLHRITFRVRDAVAGSGVLQLGVIGVGSDGTTLIDSSGGTSISSSVWVAEAGAASIGSSFVTYTGFFKDHSISAALIGERTYPANPSCLYTGSIYFRPVIGVNQASSAGQIVIDEITIETIPNEIGLWGVDGDVTIIDGWVIKTGSITAGKIDVDSLSAISANLGTVTTGLIESTNWSASAGMEIDLDNETIEIGGSSDPDFSWSPSGGLYIKGIEEDTTVTVGSGGDFSTINTAIEWLYRRRPKYDSAGITATINLLTGFTMQEQVLVNGLNLGWIKISSVDASVSIIRSNLATLFEGRYPAFGVSGGGSLPVIGTLFNMDSSGTSTSRDGFYSHGSGSSITILADCGCINSGGNSLYLTNSAVANAEGAHLYDSAAYCVYIDKNSFADVNNADVSGGDRCVYADHGSTVNAKGVDASNAGQIGLCAFYASTINAEDAIVTGAGLHNVYAYSASTINADDITATGAYAHGISANKASTINAFGADASGCNTSGLSYSGISASEGSIINAFTANGRIGATDSTQDIEVNTGSIINANNSTGGVSQSYNTPTASGIIFGY